MGDTNWLAAHPFFCSKIARQLDSGFTKISNESKNSVVAEV